MTSRLFSFACAAFLLVALVLGGASRVEVLAPDIVALASLPLLGWAIWRLRDAPLDPQERLPLLILAGCFGVGLLQLVPLPPDVWTALPGRARIVSDLSAAGLTPGWAPISLTPADTLASLLALMPATALFLAMRTLQPPGRRILVLCLLGVMAVSTVLGVLQILGGPESPLRFYAITNPEPAVGFFSNRNHLAALFYCALPLAGAEALSAHQRGDRTSAAVMLGLMLLAAAGVALTESRAGVLLLGLGLGGVLAMAWAMEAGRQRRRLILGAGLGVCLIAAVAAPFLFSQTLDRFDGDMASNLRLPVAQVAAEAAWTHAPFGSGLGSFVPVYMMTETPDSMQNTYINHAHDDWLELWLEAGVLALAVMLLFLFWFGRQVLRAWRGDRGSDGATARAAGLVVGLLLLHSLVDYPLRTPAMMCVFALACGLMLSPRAPADPQA